MVTKNLSYDAPAYLAVLPIPLVGTGTGGAGITGASGQSNKFVAFTDMLVKSVTLGASTVGTSSVASNGPLLYRVTDNGTTAVNTVTATYTLTPTGIAGGNGAAVTTAAYKVNAVPGTGVSTSAATAWPLLSTSSVGTLAYSIPVKQGDVLYVAKGTDATEVLWGSIEAVLQPFANVTM